MNLSSSITQVTDTFRVPGVLIAVETEVFSGYIWPQLLNVFEAEEIIERISNMNSWDDEHPPPLYSHWREEHYHHWARTEVRVTGAYSGYFRRGLQYLRRRGLLRS
jgi:hypothetical protein